MQKTNPAQRLVAERGITALLRRYAPGEVKDIPALRDKHRGREAALLAKVKAKYARGKARQPPR